MKYTYKQVAKATIGKKKYQVVQVNNQYYQVLLNRKKIGINRENETSAIVAMLVKANYDLEDSFVNVQNL